MQQLYLCPLSLLSGDEMSLNQRPVTPVIRSRHFQVLSRSPQTRLVGAGLGGGHLARGLRGGPLAWQGTSDQEDITEEEITDDEDDDLSNRGFALFCHLRGNENPLVQYWMDKKGRTCEA